MIDSLKEFEIQAQLALEKVGKELPLEVLLLELQGRDFNHDGSHYYATQFGVSSGGHAHPYCISLTQKNLALWRGRPQDGGTLVRDYQGKEVEALYEQLHNQPRTETFGLGMSGGGPKSDVAGQRATGTYVKPEGKPYHTHR